MVDAAARGSYSTIERLLAEGANPNAPRQPFDERTALCLAAHSGHARATRQLLAAGADASARTWHHTGGASYLTALDWALASQGRQIRLRRVSLPGSTPPDIYDEDCVEALLSALAAAGDFQAIEACAARVLDAEWLDASTERRAQAVELLAPWLPDPDKLISSAPPPERHPTTLLARSLAFDDARLMQTVAAISDPRKRCWTIAPVNGLLDDLTGVEAARAIGCPKFASAIFSRMARIEAGEIDAAISRPTPRSAAASMRL